MLEMFIWGPIPFTDFNFSISSFFSKAFAEGETCLLDKFNDSFISTRMTAQTMLIVKLLSIYTPAIILILYVLRSLKLIATSLKYINTYTKILRAQDTDSILLLEKMTLENVENYKRKLKEKTSTIDLDSLIEAREFMSI